MTVKEFRRQRRQLARQRKQAAELLARKRERAESERQERAAKASARFALQHRLPPERVFQQRPSLTLSAGFSIRPESNPEDRARRADQVLADIRRMKEVERSSKPAPLGSIRLVRTVGSVIDIH